MRCPIRARVGCRGERNEVALGAETLRTFGKEVGDRLDGDCRTEREDGCASSGRPRFRAIALNGTDALGDGAALTAAGLARLDPTAGPSFFLVDLAPGARVEQLQKTDGYRERPGPSAPNGPGAILTYGDVRSTPLLLAGLLGLLGAGVLVHLLVTSVRARRRDLAVLKTIGFTRRQLVLAVAAQATTLVLVALVIAVPLGLVIGRWTWSSFADDLGVVAGVVVPGGRGGGRGRADVARRERRRRVPRPRAARTAPALAVVGSAPSSYSRVSARRRRCGRRSPRRRTRPVTSLRR